jgi:hypothetical protein
MPAKVPLHEGDENWRRKRVNSASGRVNMDTQQETISHTLRFNTGVTDIALDWFNWQ